MGTISVFQSITLDGVMQSPGRPDEDTRGGFTHGGWGQGYQDDISMRIAGQAMARNGALLFGRRTYEDVLGHWTGLAEANPFVDVLVRTPKYVVSRAASTELGYPNSELLAGEAVKTVAELREREDIPHLMIMGSGQLIRVLQPAGLINDYTLFIHPILLGSGTRLFGGADRADLDLQHTEPTTTGVIVAQYTVRRPVASVAAGAATRGGARS